jgi:hypothetical protein
MGTDLILYQFSRSKVERVDFCHFLGPYAPVKLPTGRRLRNMMSCLTFGFRQAESSPRLSKSRFLPACC